MSGMEVTIRDATADDLPGIVAIYNDVIATSSAIWREEPTTLAERTAWFESLTGQGFPVLVAVTDTDTVDAADATDPSGGDVVGFASLGHFRSWPGYRPTVEHSIHVRADRRGAGVGHALLSALIDRAVAMGKDNLIAGVDGDNAGSVRFHERFGFREVGRMPGVGRRFDQRLDLLLLQLDLTDRRNDPDDDLDA
jgi:phosphinothricin acetyltransferase